MPAIAPLQPASPLSAELSRGPVAASSSDLETMLRVVLSSSPTPLSAPEICQRMDMLDGSKDWARAESSLRSKMTQSDWVIRLKGHGFWHRGRAYPHAGWDADVDFAPDASTTQDAALNDLRRQLQRLHGNWSELGCRHRRHLIQSRLPQLWIDGACAMEDLLDLTLRCILELAARPLKTEDFRIEARNFGAPKSVLSLVSYRTLQARWWADSIRQEGFWRLDRPAPEGMASPDHEIIEASRTLLEASDDFLTAEHLLEKLSQQGITVSLSDVDKCAILRKILKTIEGVEARSQRGFRIPKARPKLRAPTWRSVQDTARASA